MQMFAKIVSVKAAIVSVVVSLLALILGIAIGRYTALPPLSKTVSPVPAVLPSPATRSSGSFASKRPAGSENHASEKDGTPASSEDVITAIKNALGHLGSRRTFVEFGKFPELINEKNLGEVLAFAESLPKPQEKNMV